MSLFFKSLLNINCFSKPDFFDLCCFVRILHVFLSFCCLKYCIFFLKKYFSHQHIYANKPQKEQQADCLLLFCDISHDSHREQVFIPKRIDSLTYSTNLICKLTVSTALINLFPSFKILVAIFQTITHFEMLCGF